MKIVNVEFNEVVKGLLIIGIMRKNGRLRRR